MAKPEDPATPESPLRETDLGPFDQLYIVVDRKTGQLKVLESPPKTLFDLRPDDILDLARRTGPALAPKLGPEVRIMHIETHERIETQTLSQLTDSWVAMNAPTAQIQLISALATDVFGDSGVAEEWLKEPNLATDNRPPLALLGTEEGFQRVKTLLHRIDYGVLT